MELKDFFVGQIIYYAPPGTNSNGTFKGVVTHLTSNNVTIEYGSDYEREFGFTRFTYYISLRSKPNLYMTPDLNTPPLTTKEKVNQRCKDLWIKNNYVKNHPNLKYT